MEGASCLKVATEKSVFECFGGGHDAFVTEGCWVPAQWAAQLEPMILKSLMTPAALPIGQSLECIVNEAPSRWGPIASHGARFKVSYVVTCTEYGVDASALSGSSTICRNRVFLALLLVW